MTQTTTDRKHDLLVIECFYYPGCLSRDTLPDQIARALAEEQLQAQVSHLTLSVEDAQHRGIEGSPTVLVNGIDILDTPGGSGS